MINVGHSLLHCCYCYSTQTASNGVCYVYISPGSGALGSPDAHTAWLGQPAQAATLPASLL